MSFILTTWYLEMRARAAQRPGRAPGAPEEARIEQAREPSPEFSRFLYTAVGGDWHWRDRLPWTKARWTEHLRRPQVQTWVLWVRGTPAGYVELEAQGLEAQGLEAQGLKAQGLKAQGKGDVEIAYFGLIPRFIGRGLGGWLLGEATVRAWDMGARRVWVHTCNLDGPAALANYRARGFDLYHTEQRRIEDPGSAMGPWPGAYGE